MSLSFPMPFPSSRRYRCPCLRRLFVALPSPYLRARFPCPSHSRLLPIAHPAPFPRFPCPSRSLFLLVALPSPVRRAPFSCSSRSLLLFDALPSPARRAPFRHLSFLSLIPSRPSRPSRRPTPSVHTGQPPCIGPVTHTLTCDTHSRSANSLPSSPLPFPVSFPPFPPLSLPCRSPCPSLRFPPCPSLHLPPVFPSVSPLVPLSLSLCPSLLPPPSPPFLSSIPNCSCSLSFSSLVFPRPSDLRPYSHTPTLPVTHTCRRHISLTPSLLPPSLLPPPLLPPSLSIPLLFTLPFPSRCPYPLAYSDSGLLKLHPTYASQNGCAAPTLAFRICEPEER
ncbi:unnamed protein product [Closterium sp. Naga37s-1]|nr:unnamed protein product [Closterium sp. Naga37s-1]